MANVQNDDQNTNKNSEIVSNFSNIEESKKDNRSICCYARVSTQNQLCRALHNWFYAEEKIML